MSVAMGSTDMRQCSFYMAILALQNCFGYILLIPYKIN